MHLNLDITRVAFGYLAEKLATTGVEALVIDTVHFFIELIPLGLSMPYVHIWNVLHLDFSGATPASVFSYPLDSSPEGLNRNAESLRKLGAILGPLTKIARSYAEKIGLNIDWNDPAATVSKLAVITQTPREFDFPGIPWPAQFHYAGPFHDHEGRRLVFFPWEQLTGKPLIYASLGTLVNGLDDVYKHIFKAVEPLEDVQVVLSVGKNISPENLGRIPLNTIVVRSAPQIELLKRAALCITHAGLNTVLESLAHGVPMVAVPIGYDHTDRISWPGRPLPASSCMRFSSVKACKLGHRRIRWLRACPQMTRSRRGSGGRLNWRVPSRCSTNVITGGLHCRGIIHL
jgi:zeaxanthin glucosyltransferase